MIATGFQDRLAEARRLLLGGAFPQALARYDRLTRLCPGQAVVWVEFGNAAFRLGQRETASRAWQKAVALEPHNAELMLRLGHQYQGARQPAEARACFARAAAADPRAINPRISLAMLFEREHRMAEARVVVEECLSIDGSDEQASYLLAVLDRREHLFDAAETRLRALIQGELKHPYVRYAARYELAQILDRTERFDEAMQNLAEAKQLVRALADVEGLLKGYDRGAEQARRFASAQPRNILSQWARSIASAGRPPAEKVALLGGHPRSGTTLLEQVLGAHPGIAALDEPHAFASAVQPVLRETTEMPAARLKVLRRNYAQALLEEYGPTGNGKLLLDKNPSLTAQLPAVLRVMPDLRAVVLLRDPRDVILSCYFQNILLNPTNANFLSFERLAKHYADLMDVWLAVREWEGFAWLETRYEDIVVDLEREGRGVTAFLGLTWQTEQIRFYQQGRRLYSPTYQDVTRPVYAHSVGRWRAYEKHLAPVLPALDPYCRRFGYWN